MIKLTCSIFISYNNLFIILFTNVKMCKDSSVKYHQNNKERLQKQQMKDIKVFLKKKTQRQYGCKQYKNLPEDVKQKLGEDKMVS